MIKDVSHLSDEALVVLVRSQDQELYTELVKRYQDKLMRYANGLIGNQDKAADVVQEAFIKAFVNLKGFNTKKKFSSWLYRITHNQAINYLKKYKKEISLEDNQRVKGIIKSNEDVELDFIRQEVETMLYLALQELDLKYRSPLVLFYLDGKSYEEISDILRIPIGTVGIRINRGKKLMRVIYQKKEGKDNV